MKTNIKVLAAGFVALAFSVSSNANLSILDSFEYTDNYYPSDTTDYQNVFSIDGNDGYAYNSGAGAGLTVGYSVAGALVTYYLDPATPGAGAGATNEDLIFGGAAGYLNFNAPGVPAYAPTLSINYSGLGVPSDFTNLGDSFVVGFAGTDNSNAGDFDLKVTVTTLGGSLTVDKPILGSDYATSGQLALAFDEFTGTGSFTQVTNIFMQVITEAGSSLDMNVDYFGVVHAPATIGLLGLSLVGLGLSRRRMKISK